jgi:sugar-specific transcriptional regulator TrmB
VENKTNSPFLEKNINEVLKRNGFTNNEILVYTYLLENGRSKSGPIIRGTNIVSSAFYEAILSLTKKGFVSYEVINNIKYYNPETPERQINQLKNDIKDLESVSSLLGQITLDQRNRNLINVYEGNYGFKRAFEQFAENLKPKDQIKIIGYNTDYKRQHDFRRFFTELDRKIEQRGGSAKVLVQKELLSVLRKDRVGIEMYDIKTLPSKYFGPIGMDIGPNEVVISIIADNPITISMKHPVIVESFHKNFDYLWKFAK